MNNLKNLKGVIGDNPHDEMNPQVHQNYDDTCAIKSQQLILNDFGVYTTEDVLVQQANQLGIYTPGAGGGTSPEDVGKLLELNGVQCTQHEDATIYDLTSALAQGQKVIIGVDSGELWNNDRLSDIVSGEQADHALIVAGIDTSDPNDVQVILTDPGTGQEGARYSMDQFLDAWHDSGNFMVTTDAPAPLAYNPEMINFDYSEGHIPMIGEMPYEYFDQQVLPISQTISIDPHLTDMLHQDFIGLVAGDLHTISPQLVAAIENVPILEIRERHDDPYPTVEYDVNTNPDLYPASPEPMNQDPSINHDDDILGQATGFDHNFHNL